MILNWSTNLIVMPHSMSGGVSEKSLRFMEGFIRDLGLYTDSFKEKFIKTVDEVRMIDEGVFKEVFAKEKERAK